MAKRFGSGVALLVLHADDNVATALRDLAAGDTVPYDDVAGERRMLRLTDAVPFGHKVAVQDVEAGGLLYKYGEVIGRATAPISAGSHVHVHNVESLRGRGDVGGQHSA